MMRNVKVKKKTRTISLNTCENEIQINPMNLISTIIQKRKIVWICKLISITEISFTATDMHGNIDSKQYQIKA